MAPNPGRASVFDRAALPNQQKKLPAID